ncbi:hypothetical protein E3P99_03694 [Wallemia hederae]|uniref:C2H2-type domain-containing protein n=1 Tax=Wallemia hederae TaxID=1540922 RepID=A0A4V4LSF8_9BASI|nr:hypothetical protein E3P99_03694 [Wallemia hederae]
MNQQSFPFLPHQQRGYYVDSQQQPFYLSQQFQQPPQAHTPQPPPPPPPQLMNQPHPHPHPLNHIKTESPMHQFPQPASPPKGRRKKADPNESLGPQRKPRSQPTKLFQCTGYGNCSMQFTRSEHLARHVRKHTGERPFKCHCGKAFSRLDNLRQHAGTVHADQPELNDSLLKGMSNLHSQLAANASQKQLADAQVVDRRDGSTVATESQRGKKRHTTKKLAIMSSTPSSSPIPTASVPPALPPAPMTHTPPTDHMQHRSAFPNHHMVLQGSSFNWSPNMYPSQGPPSVLGPSASPMHQAMVPAGSMQSGSHSAYAPAHAPAPIMDAHPSNSSASASASSAAPPVLEEWSPHNQTPVIPHALRPTPTSTPIPLVRDTPESVNTAPSDSDKLPPLSTVVDQHQPQHAQQQQMYQAPMLPSPTQTTTYKPHSSQGYRPSTSEYFSQGNYFDPAYQYSSNMQPLPFRKNSFQSNGMFGYQPPSDNPPNPNEGGQPGGPSWDEYSIRPRSSRKGNIGFNESIPYLPPPSSSGMGVPFGTSRPMSSSEALRPLSSANNEASSSSIGQSHFNHSNQSSNPFKFDPITRADGEEVEEEDDEESDDRPGTNASRRQSILDLCGGEAGPRQQQASNDNDAAPQIVLAPLKNTAAEKAEYIGLGIKEEDGLEAANEDN